MEKVSQNLDVKKKLLAECVKKHTVSVESVKEAMVLAEEGANEEQSNTEEQMESFRTQCFIDREMYAKQLQEGLSAFSTLNLISPSKINESVSLGSVIFTDKFNYFIGISLGKMEIDGQSFFVISTNSPIYQAMAGKKKGEKFSFRNQSYVINDVF
jgi:transcription elongation GreA/GreB family factor